MKTWVQMEAARKEKYPEISGGNMLLKKEEEETKPIDCVRVTLQHTRACPKGVKISSPEDAVKLMREMEGYDRERAMIVHLSTKNHVLAVENIAIGSLNAAIIHPRESIKGAVINSAANIIFLHNHPSGDPAPSVEDIAIVKKLRQAFDTVGIDMLDSIIIGRETYYSFKEHGELFPESKFKESKPGEMKIMERKYKEESEEDDRCSTATEAALSVISEQCGVETGEPEQGRFLRMQIKQEIKHIHALALGTATHPGHSAQSYAEHAIKLIDNGVDNDLISSEYAEVLRGAVQTNVSKR